MTKVSERYDRFLAGTFPNYQLARLRARAATAITNRYDGAKDIPMRKQDPDGPNVSISGSSEKIRATARGMEQNADLINAALAIFENNIVGMGIEPQPMILRQSDSTPMDDINEELSEIWREWAKRPEATNTHNEMSAQKLLVRTWLRDGDVFIQHLQGIIPGYKHPNRINLPYSYELIEPDSVPLDLIDERRQIINGIEVDDWRRPRAIHFATRISSARMSVRSMRTARVPIEYVTHLGVIKRIGQVRGISLFAHAIKRISEIDEIDDAERMAAKIAAMIALFVKKGIPDLYNPPVDDDGDPQENEREISLRPGQVYDDLQPGETIETASSNRPNPNVMGYRSEQLRALSGGIGVGYSSLSKHYDGNYSSQRQEMIEQNKAYYALWNLYVGLVESEKWIKFVQMAILSKAIVIPKEAKPMSIENCHFAPPALPWIDPVKEASAYDKLVNARIESRAAIMRSRGRNPREVEKEIAREDGLYGDEQDDSPDTEPQRRVPNGTNT